MSNSKPGLFAGTVLSKAFKTDPELENKGVWRDHDSGIVARIRRSTRTEHKKALRRYFKPFQHVTNLDPKIEQQVKMKAGAEELVADWGMRDKDSDAIGPLLDASGEPIECTFENVLAAFTEMPDFFQWVSDEADTFELYRLAAVEEASGNSLDGSAGSESGDHPLSSLDEELLGESGPAR